MPMPRLGIIADDLTGALDSAAPFAARGLHVAVALAPEHIGAALQSGPEIIAVTTRSRDIPAEAAEAEVRKTAAALAGVRLFKKIDSRLKGNIEAELAALDPGSLLVAPGLPAFGRIVSAGHVSGFGVPEPIEIAARLGRFADRAAIPETTTEAEMAALLPAGDALLVGARGLAEALAAQLSDRPARMVKTLPGPDAAFVIGSTDPITLRQIACLRAAQDLRYIGAPNGRTPVFPAAGLTLLQALPGADPATGAEVAAALAAAIPPGLQSLLLSGGATAEAILARLGIDILRLCGECLPGLAVGLAKGMTIVTKSGGFGTEDSLVQVARMIEGVA